MGKKYGNKTKHEFPEPCQPTRSKCTSLPTKWRTLIVRPLKAEGCRNWLGILLVMRDGWKIIQLYYPICKTYVEDFPMPMVAWIFRLAMLDFRYPRNWKVLNQRNRVCIHPSPIWVTHDVEMLFGVGPTVPTPSVSSPVIKPGNGKSLPFDIGIVQNNRYINERKTHDFFCDYEYYLESSQWMVFDVCFVIFWH